MSLIVRINSDADLQIYIINTEGTPAIIIFSPLSWKDSSLNMKQRTESVLWSQVPFIFFQDGETFKKRLYQTNKQLTHLPSTSQKNPSIYIWTGSDIRGRASLFPEASQDRINVLKRFVDLSSFFSSWNLTHDYRIITHCIVPTTALILEKHLRIIDHIIDKQFTFHNSEKIYIYWAHISESWCNYENISVLINRVFFLCMKMVFNTEF